MSNVGTVTCYTGPMFSQKSTGLILEVEVAQEQGNSVRVFKPKIDNRYAENNIITHDGYDLFERTGIKTESVPLNFDFLEVTNVKVICIDEAQFFTKLTSSVKGLIKRGIDVIVAGLDLDSNGNPFGCMPELLCFADFVYKRQAQCIMCENPANRTYRKQSIENNSQILIGGSETYEPRCLSCWMSH